MALIVGDWILLHTPKTAGDWTRAALAAAGVDFQRLRPLDWTANHHRVQDLTPDQRSGRRVAAFVRHPVAWLASFYAHRSRRGWPDRIVSLDSLRADTFGEFIRLYLDQQPGAVGRIFRDYTEGVNFIGRQEHAAADLLELLRMTGVAFDPRGMLDQPSVNVSGNRPRVSPEQAAAIIEAEAWAVQRFGYADQPWE